LPCADSEQVARVELLRFEIAVAIATELRYRRGRVHYDPRSNPGPCHGCSHAPRCAVSGQICIAFSAFVVGRPWKQLTREPSPTVTAIENVRQRQQIRRDAIEERRLERLARRREKRKARLSAR
jgi:hypothetical protein